MNFPFCVYWSQYFSYSYKISDMISGLPNSGMHITKWKADVAQKFPCDLTSSHFTIPLLGLSYCNHSVFSIRNFPIFILVN